MIPRELVPSPFYAALLAILQVGRIDDASPPHPQPLAPEDPPHDDFEETRPSPWIVEAGDPEPSARLDDRLL